MMKKSEALHEVTRADFVQAVKEFKRKHGKKLKELLRPDHPDAVKEFWGNSIVRSYLMRLSIAFIDKHPDLRDSTDKSIHENSDHYELKIYKYLPDVLLYRNEFIAQSIFYNEGTTDHPVLYHYLQGINQNSHEIEIVDRNSTLQSAQSDLVYRLIDKSKPIPRFLIQKLSNEGHATTLLGILDPEIREVCLIVHINSDDNRRLPKRIEEVKNAFQSCQNQSHPIPIHDIKAQKKYLHDIFPTLSATEATSLEYPLID
jgi:hypothetical protein